MNIKESIIRTYYVIYLQEVEGKPAYVGYGMKCDESTLSPIFNLQTNVSLAKRWTNENVGPSLVQRAKLSGYPDAKFIRVKECHRMEEIEFQNDYWKKLSPSFK